MSEHTCNKETEIAEIHAMCKRTDEAIRGNGKPGRICCVGGFYEYETRTMYVERDKWHPERPVFEYFGHEVWHLPELGGRFHK